MLKRLIKLWYLIPIILLTPILINYILLIESPIQIIGKSENWLSFWGTYIASIISGLITLIVLYATLKQNEINNNLTKKLQIDIFKKQLEERRLSDFTQFMKENLSYIDWVTINDNILLTYEKDYSAPFSFFKIEAKRTLSKKAVIELEFISKVNNNTEIEFKTKLTKLLDEYIILINVVLRLVTTLQLENLNKRKNKFEELYKKDTVPNLFSVEEFNLVMNTQFNNTFDDQLLKILENKHTQFTKSYSCLQNDLIKLSLIIIKNRVLEFEKIDTSA